MKLTIYFDGQFWVGVAEKEEGTCVKAARHVFGGEPHDADLFRFVNHEMLYLLEKAKPESSSFRPSEHSANPKRLARQAAKEMQAKGISTASQEAIKADLEARKREQKTESKQRREETAERKRQIATLKAKAKHKGR